MSKDLWMIEHERIGEEFASERIEEDEARARMKALGFDPHEIDEQMDALWADLLPDHGAPIP